MKIAVASEGKFVSAHFGHCEGFTVYDVDESKGLKKDFIQNPGHRPGFLPNFLKESGVNVVISGGMGETAQQLFAQNNIDVIVGAEGSCDDVVQQYLKGELKSTGSICREHQHEGHCHE
ncbi:NifB/NifX family molybdenum-iron cluster-binding protein [Acetivibrio saccincola]|uniref:Dinitrogenase iron-molybdenum cofactor n=1 Tax=Acetivibrio saccincola TaxID=1677857 RepID=A0A2S8R6C3_9FIRM|nr:NifB/NifX family molybdenum-iron cluster-binding protein [Acetivibrio saccincola]PQQ65341.1 dinitrogenase iron-molybdenum cofactor [Acetivibrio saccincola]